jgi:hypothetical protein
MNDDDNKKIDKTTLMATTATLPMMAGSFDDQTDDGRDRLIQGTILACVDGKWTARDESELPDKLIAIQTAQAVQHWKDGRPVPGDTTTTRPLPDVEYLNSQIPIDQWEKGFDDEPRAPWQHQHIAYLLDPETFATYTFINSTYGAMLAVSDLKEQVRMIRGVRGGAIVPVVELASKPMKTKRGMKQRPSFRVLDWIELGGHGQAPQPVPAPVVPPVKPAPTMIEHTPAKSAIERIGSSVEAVSFQEELDDELPFITANGNDGQRRRRVAFAVV